MLKLQGGSVYPAVCCITHCFSSFFHILYERPCHSHLRQSEKLSAASCFGNMLPAAVCLLFFNFLFSPGRCTAMNSIILVLISNIFLHILKGLPHTSRPPLQAHPSRSSHWAHGPDPRGQGQNRYRECHSAP